MTVTRGVPQLALRHHTMLGHLTRRYSVRSAQAAEGPTRVAVLYQELEPPIINGQKKPKKPGGKFNRPSRRFGTR